ncbi:hypothetical protein M9B40_03400 [SAR86 cluster bacterium]|jgi:hypothetical protein|uniref:Uncharacterized protein n=1 Tax=SAR86 cluster bacterium TaxID=2030880 RepID=A0A9Q8TXI2_9GAMM|nr:hypothetical protein M9B40_03400 [SAR86 cluster bacterium]
MFVDIALQFILATVIGSIWAAPLVVTPAARKTLDKEALKFFLRSFFFRLNFFLIVFLGLYLGIYYFLKLGTYELFLSNSETLLASIMVVTIFLNLFISLLLSSIDQHKNRVLFNTFHLFSVVILIGNSFAATYLLVQKFLLI